MRFGLFLQPVHHPTEHPTLALERDLELVQLLDRLGYEEVWVGEHHSTGWENIAAPDIFIAAAAERTRHIRLGTGVVQLGLHHPLIAIDRMILLDHLTRGRAMFGVGVGGGLPSDLKVFGLTPEVAGRRLDEGMDLILRLLESEEPITESTDWYEVHNAALQIRPFTQPHMPLAVASTDQRNIEMMGRVGGSVLTGPLPDRVPEILTHLERGAHMADRSASRDQIMLSYGLHLAESHDRAVQEIVDGAMTEQREFVVGVNGRPQEGVSDQEMFTAYVDNQLIGTPEEVIAKIEALQERSGGFGGILFISRDWAGTEAAQRSWELFARRVAPHFQGHVGQQSRAAAAATALNSAD